MHLGPDSHAKNLFFEIYFDTLHLTSGKVPFLHHAKEVIREDLKEDCKEDFKEGIFFV